MNTPIWFIGPYTRLYNQYGKRTPFFNFLCDAEQPFRGFSSITQALTFRTNVAPDTIIITKRYGSLRRSLKRVTELKEKYPHAEFIFDVAGDFDTSELNQELDRLIGKNEVNWIPEDSYSGPSLAEV